MNIIMQFLIIENNIAYNDDVFNLIENKADIIYLDHHIKGTMNNYFDFMV